LFWFVLLVAGVCSPAMTVFPVTSYTVVRRHKSQFPHKLSHHTPDLPVVSVTGCPMRVKKPGVGAGLVVGTVLVGGSANRAILLAQPVRRLGQQFHIALHVVAVFHTGRRMAEEQSRH